MQKPLINIGDKIHCPTCKAIQLEVTHPIQLYSRISPEYFKVPDISRFKLAGESLMISYCCQTPFFVNGALYVNMEWIPHWPFNMEEKVKSSSLQP